MEGEIIIIIIGVMLLSAKTGGDNLPDVATFDAPDEPLPTTKLIS
eukprot:COSAG05_NODE_23870_length_255_cov_0.660256_1_plen_44_part_10